MSAVSNGKVTCALVLIAILSSFVSAFSVVDVETIDNNIIFGEKAVFNLTIKNERAERQDYEIFSPAGVKWSVATKPLRNKEMTIASNKTASTLIIVEPVEKLKAGVYGVILNIESDFGEKYEKQLKVYLSPSTPSEYLPSVRITVDMPDKIDPRQTQSIKVFLENLNPLNLNGMALKMISDIPEMNAEQTVDLSPTGEATIEFTVKLAEAQQPKDYHIFFQLERGEEVVKVVDKQVEVIPVTEAFTKQIDEKKSFLKNERTIIVTNEGNVKNTQTVILEAGLFERLFTYSSPKSKTVKADGKRMIGWEIELGANEQVTIKAVTSYRTPFVVLVLVVIGTILYFIYRNPIALSKSAGSVVLHEGGISGLKVTLVAKNLSGQAVKDLEVTDQVPGIANVEKDIEMGTLKPSQMLRGKHGQVFVKWKLSEIEGKEERIITYKIKTKLNIIGTITLGRAKATYLTSGGKKKTSYSNTYRVGTGE